MVRQQTLDSSSVFCWGLSRDARARRAGAERAGIAVLGPAHGLLMRKFQ